MKNLKNKIKEFSSYIKSIGGAEFPDNDLVWQINTIYGPLVVSIWRSDFIKNGALRQKKNNFVSIFTRFRDIEKSQKFLIEQDGNRFSGKWNFHEYGSRDIEHVWNSNFERFKKEIDKILVKF